MYPLFYYEFTFHDIHFVCNIEWDNIEQQSLYWSEEIGFTTTECKEDEKMELSLNQKYICSFNNASVHRCKLMRELHPIRKRSILFFFFLLPYNPHSNIAETLWRIFKGNWLRSVNHYSTDPLPYTTNKALAVHGSEPKINFAHAAYIN